MKNADASVLLKLLILEKEAEQAMEGKLLKEQFRLSYQSLNPLNLLKSGFKEVAASSDLKSNLVNTAIGLSVGVLTKKLYTGKSHNPLTKLLGMFMEVAVANLVAKNADGIKTAGSYILKKILSHTTPSEKT